MAEYYLKRKGGVFSFRLVVDGLEARMEDEVILLGGVHQRFARHTQKQVEQDLLKYQNGGALIEKLRTYLKIDVRCPKH